LNERSKKRRVDDRRLEILASAGGAIRRLGLRGAGMREIAEAAGLSAGNLYYYFRNKEELVYFCQVSTLDALIDVAKTAAATDGGAAAQLAHLVNGHLRVLLDSRTAGAVHLEFDDLPPALYQKLVRKRDRYEQRVRALIVDGQARGEVRAGDAKLKAFALLGALNWSARWFHPGGAYAVGDVAQSFADQLLGGLLSCPGSSRSKIRSCAKKRGSR
jgi:AcrR family transcriptional regulator